MQEEQRSTAQHQHQKNAAQCSSVGSEQSVITQVCSRWSLVVLLLLTANQIH
jgi:hypothetical protein